MTKKKGCFYGKFIFKKQTSTKGPDE